jgi:hypothetical protein
VWNPEGAPACYRPISGSYYQIDTGREVGRRAKEIQALARQMRRAK